MGIISKVRRCSGGFSSGQVGEEGAKQGRTMILIRVEVWSWGLGLELRLGLDLRLGLGLGLASTMFRNFIISD